jgi:hypothetical protein
MQLARNMRRLVAVFAAIAAAALVPVAARAIELRDLAGWWLAVDDTFPNLVQAQVVVPMEELVIVQPDGTVENRMLLFNHPDPALCASTRSLCSDAPLLAHARLTVDAHGLAFAARTEAAARIDTVETDVHIRRLALTAGASWTVRLLEGGRRLELRATQPAWTSVVDSAGVRLVQRTPEVGVQRAFVKVTPDRLRRLWAGWKWSERIGNWRCYLANATAGDAAFATTRRAVGAAPDFLEQFLHVASYLTAIERLAAPPTADDPDPDQRRLAAVPIEQMMLERFDDVPAPKSVLDKQQLLARAFFLRARIAGQDAEQAGAAIARIGRPAAPAVSEAQIALLGRLLRNPSDAADLFCRN